MKLQFFTLTGCPACAALESFMRDAGLAYDRIELASPRHAGEVLVLLCASDPRCPALSQGDTSVTGLAACLALLGQGQPARGALAGQAFPGAARLLVDGVLSGRVLMARSERAFMLALGKLREAIAEWTERAGAMPASMRRAGLSVPYLDLHTADVLSGGRFRLMRAFGADDGALSAMTQRLPAGFEDAYLDRMRRGRSWVYWEGGSVLGERALRLHGIRGGVPGANRPAAGGLLA